MLSPVLVVSLALLPATGDGGATSRCDAASSDVSAACQGAPVAQVASTAGVSIAAPGDVWELPTRVPDRVAATSGRLLATVLPDADSRDAPDAAVPATEAPARLDPPRPRAVEYSDAYHVRLQIHRAASFTMLPLFATQYVLGRKLYSGNFSDNTRRWHRRVAFGIGTLFAANTVTGVWNLVEGRKEPHHRGRRILHGLLMLTADAGFTVAGINAPRVRHGALTGFSQSTHRALAVSSVGVATAGYLVMLLGH